MTNNVKNVEATEVTKAEELFNIELENAIHVMLECFEKVKNVETVTKTEDFIIEDGELVDINIAISLLNDIINNYRSIKIKKNNGNVTGVTISQ